MSSYRCSDIDIGQNATSLGFECPDDALQYGGELSARGLGDIAFHLNALNRARNVVAI